jgi:hypothetical protein
MARSGLHPIGNWIRLQHGDMTYYNDVQVDYGKFTGTALCRGDTATFLGFEDFDMNAWDRERFPDRLKRFDRVYPVIVMRDLRNWLASCYKAYLSHHHVPWRRFMIEGLGGENGRIARWVRLMAEYLGQGAVDNPIPVSFNRWFIDRTYRWELTEALNIPFTDKGKEEVYAGGRFGGSGSSFDYKDFDGRASEMDVLNRWKVFADDPEYAALLDEYKDALGLSDLHLGTPGNWK